MWGQGSRAEPARCGQPAPLPGTVPVPQGLATDLTPGGKCSVYVKYCWRLTERNERKNVHPLPPAADLGGWARGDLHIVVFSFISLIFHNKMCYFIIRKCILQNIHHFVSKLPEV